MKTKPVYARGRTIARFLLVFFLTSLFSSGLYAQYPAGSPVAINGKLRLVGNQLSNECGNPVQLRGMSTHGPQWFPGCYNGASLDALTKDWGIDILRLAMYVREGGYSNNPSYWRGWIDNMVNECGKRGIYCLIDWHILNPGDPWADINLAREFWTYMSAQHSGKKHVLYEICNEPNGVDWNRVKTYAEDIIPRIRANDPNTVIIVGTPTWSQDVDIAANNKLNYSNVMYTLHFYSGSHGASLRSKANTALSRGIGIFVTEFGTSQATGDGGPYLGEAQAWIDWMASNKISWVNWSFADKAEVSAALSPGACGGNWNSTSQSGSFIKQRILSPADNFNCGNSQPPPPVPQSPYGGTAVNIPGKIEAERYDLGGSGVAYNDGTAGNEGSAFRTDDVDVEATTDAGGGYNVGWTAAGEWLEYTVNVTATGTYDFEARVAATTAGKSFRIEMNGSSIGTVNVPNTGGWQTFSTVTISGVNLTAGEKVMRIYCVTDGFNINYINVKSAGNQPPPNQAPSVSINSPANNASFTAPASITITASASDADGSVSKVEFFSGSTKLGEDQSSPYSFTWSNVAAGSYSITARATDNAGAVTTSSPVSVTVMPVQVSQSPYGGTAAIIPGKIEAERYDLGGSGVAYNDGSAGNEGSAFRTDDVDVEATTDAGGGYNVGWTAAGEWLEYTVNVTAAGTYDFEARVAAIAAGKSFRIEMNGSNIGTVNVPNTGGWQTYSTVTITGVNLTAGQKVMRIFCVTDGFNINYINVKSAGTQPPPPNQAPSVSVTSPANNASFTAPAAITIAVNASDADGSVSKVEFFSGSTKLGEDLSSPYSFTWSNVAAGNYSITARATDNAGAVTTSSPVSVTVTAVNTDPCPAVAVPLASQFVVRNDWADQNNGSGTSNTSDALNITHRQWGRNYLWVVQSGKNLNLQSGKIYTVSFDFRNDASNAATSIEVGFSRGLNWDGPVLTQPVVSAGTGGSSYTSKTVTINSTYSGTGNLVFRLNWSGQPNQEVNTFIKNLSVCVDGSAVKIGAVSFDDQSAEPVNFAASPNPFESSTIVMVKDAMTVPVKILVSDITGLTRQEVETSTNEEVDLGAGLPAGIYVVQATYEGKTVVFRIVKN